MKQIKGLILLLLVIIFISYILYLVFQPLSIYNRSESPDIVIIPVPWWGYGWRPWWKKATEYNT
jgi:hypothetical protein